MLALAGSPIGREDDRRMLEAFARELAASIQLEELEASASAAGTLAAANELRTAILSAVSHDLRTPLAGIKASVTSLLQQDVDWTPEERAEFLATIDEETDRLNDLVGNLLDMSRLQTGAPRDPRGARRPRRGAPGGSSQPRRTAAADVALDVPETLPPVLADAGLLERALANVIANAVRYSLARARRPADRSRRGRRRRRRADRRPRPGRPAARNASDVPPLPAARRLQSHATASGSGSRSRKGFVEAMGGTIEVEDTPGGGLTVIVRLRASRVTRILVVDDEPQILRALATNLRARGYEVELAATGEEALQLAATQAPRPRRSSTSACPGSTASR